MNATFDDLVGSEARTLRTVKFPAGVGATREPRRRSGRLRGAGRVIPNNPEMVEWLDASTPGWYSAMYGETLGSKPSRAIVFSTMAHASLFKLFWT